MIKPRQFCSFIFQYRKAIILAFSAAHYDTLLLDFISFSGLHETFLAPKLLLDGEFARQTKCKQFHICFKALVFFCVFISISQKKYLWTSPFIYDA